MSHILSVITLYLSVMSYHLGSAEAGHANAPTVMAVEVETVERGQQPQVDARDPHQHCVLETLRQVWVGRVPCAVPVLVTRQKHEL